MHGLIKSNKSMVDIDKFICDFIRSRDVEECYYKTAIANTFSIMTAIEWALRQQGIIYKDGQLQRLDGSCESSKDENIPYSPELTEFEEKLGSIIFNTWDIMKDCEECKGDVDYIKEKADELLGIASRNSKVKEEGYSKSEEYDEIALRDGDDNGITIQVMAYGRNVSDFRISKGQAHILKAELEAYICKF